MKKLKNLEPSILIITYLFAGFALLLLEIGVVFSPQINDTISAFVFIGAVSVSAILLYKKSYAAAFVLPLGAMIAIYAVALQLQFLTFDPVYAPSLAAFRSSNANLFGGFFDAYYMVPLISSYALLGALYFIKHETGIKAKAKQD
jgi:hypothetical protein